MAQKPTRGRRTGGERDLEGLGPWALRHLVRDLDEEISALQSKIAELQDAPGPIVKSGPPAAKRPAMHRGRLIKEPSLPEEMEESLDEALEKQDVFGSAFTDTTLALYHLHEYLDPIPPGSPRGGPTDREMVLQEFDRYHENLRKSAKSPFERWAAKTLKVYRRRAVSSEDSEPLDEEVVLLRKRLGEYRRSKLTFDSDLIKAIRNYNK